MIIVTSDATSQMSIYHKRIVNRTASDITMLLADWLVDPALLGPSAIFTGGIPKAPSSSAFLFAAWTVSAVIRGSGCIASWDGT
jgi:hypothetical protein